MNKLDVILKAELTNKKYTIMLTDLIIYMLILRTIDCEYLIVQTLYVIIKFNY